MPTCVDCIRDGVTTERAAPYGGPKSPLCFSHRNARRRKTRQRRHETHVQRTYEISPERYQELYDQQGGLCAICGPTTGNRGASRKLSVDHDHRCCPGPISCGKCVRGLVCQTCNDFLGRVRDDPRAFLRGYAYLLSPPAQRSCTP